MIVWSFAASLAIHAIVIALLFYVTRQIVITRGERETVMETTRVTFQKEAPHPAAALVRVRRRRPTSSRPAKAPPRELARIVPTAASPLPAPRSTTSNLERDEAGFAREAARLNAQNDLHALPTIAPASRGATIRSYRFAIPKSLRGEDEGNGIITPVRAWRDAGHDCYYGRYEFTYPDGAMETGDIVWPFCFDPALDPFKEAPHMIPFPLPLPGFTLPAGTELPPIEKAVYQHWAAQYGGPP